MRPAAAMRGPVIATGGGAACREDNLARDAGVRAGGGAVGDAGRGDPPDRHAARGARCCTARPIPRARPRRCWPSASRSTRAPTTASTPRAARPTRSPREIVLRLESSRAPHMPMLARRCLVISVGVELGARRYDVRIGALRRPTPWPSALADGAGPATTGVAVLVDGGLAPALAARRRRWWRRSARALPRVRAPRPAGRRGVQEPGARSSSTTEWLAAEGFDRRAAVVGIGGGATSDHAGFAAAIYLRGVALRDLPDHAAGDGRRVGRRQDRRRSAAPARTWSARFTSRAR